MGWVKFRPGPPGCARKNARATLQSLAIGPLCPALRALPSRFFVQQRERKTSVNRPYMNWTTLHLDARRTVHPCCLRRKSSNELPVLLPILMAAFLNGHVWAIDAHDPTQQLPWPAERSGPLKADATHYEESGSQIICSTSMAIRTILTW